MVRKFASRCLDEGLKVAPWCRYLYKHPTETLFQNYELHGFGRQKSHDPAQMAPGDWLGRLGNSGWIRAVRTVASGRPMAPMGGLSCVTASPPQPSLSGELGPTGRAMSVTDPRPVDREALLNFGWCALEATAATPSGLMLNAKKVNGSLAGFPPLWWTRSNGS